MAEARVESPFNLFSNSSIDKELAALKGPLLKRKEQSDDESFFEPQAKKPRVESFTPVKEQEKGSELFPQVKRSLPLPEEAEEVNFDRPSFTAPREKKESKPTLPAPTWDAAKPTETKKDEETTSSFGSWIKGLIPWGKEKSDITIGTHRIEEQTPHEWISAKPSKTATQAVEPLIGFNHRVNYKHQKETLDELSRLPNHGGAVLAKLVGMITDYQNLSQVSQLDLFAHNSDRLQELRRKEFENTLKQIECRKDEETWSYRREMLEYFGIATGAIGGASLIGTSISTGGISLAPGVKMLAGSGVALAAKITSKYTGDQTITPIIGLGGSLVSGWGMAQGWKALESIPKTLATGSSIAAQLGNTITQKKGADAKNMQYKVNAKNIKVQFERETTEQDMRKLVGGLKASKASTELLGATTKALRTENEIKSQIALGDKY